MLAKRKLGRTNINVSLLGFGGIPIMRVTPAEATDTIGEALRSGVDFFDTARTYGDSESKMGDAFKVHGTGSAHGGSVVLASKSPRRDRDGMLEDFDKSLSDLKMETIDLYQLHCVNKEEDLDKALSPGGAYGALEEMRTAGRVHHIGITSHNLEIVKRAIASDRFDTIQVLYNFVEPEASQEVIPMAAEKDIGIIAMKPFAGGCISRYDVALRYVLRTPGVIAIPGMAAAGEVALNVKVATELAELTRSDLDAIAAVREKIGKDYCRRCDYCQPCPNEIPIAFVLHIPSIRKRMGDDMMRGDSYRGLLDKVRLCDECGQCEERCPFGLAVRDLIRVSREELVEVLE
jgi:predicted aldo/keto reductase-like oxidoreductase